MWCCETKRWLMFLSSRQELENCPDFLAQEIRQQSRSLLCKMHCLPNSKMLQIVVKSKSCQTNNQNPGLVSCHAYQHNYNSITHQKSFVRDFLYVSIAFVASQDHSLNIFIKYHVVYFPTLNLSLLKYYLHICTVPDDRVA